ncbi:MAG TPA: NAD(P)-dependent oxidoreductase [Chitinispirillaceae bacterium]|nr:NAD(P)-dependent oxidoreductase [Chitinispirillaceae bacterium]
MNIGICLFSPVDAFTVSSEMIATLRGYFPSHSFTLIGDFETLSHSLHLYDVLITWTFKKNWYQKACRLKAIFTPAAGSECIERDPEHSIPVFHGTFHGPLMAETLCAMMFFFNKQFPRALADQKQHHWNRNSYSNGRRLGSQTILFYGFGSIARTCANLLKQFGCTIWAVKRSEADPLRDKSADLIVSPEQVHQIVCNADHIVSILPSNESTNNIFNREFFQSTKPSSCFYNLGRGNCCNEADLLWALDNNRIAGAGLDVFQTEPLPSDSPLWNHPCVLIYPHASAINSDYLPFYIAELRQTLRPFLA